MRTTNTEKRRNALKKYRRPILIVSLTVFFLLILFITFAVLKKQVGDRSSTTQEEGKQVFDLPRTIGSEREQGEEAEASAPADSTPDGFTEPVPDGYFTDTEHAGTVETLEYKSGDYAGDFHAITKHCYVYLPYGYDPEDTEKRYDVMYVMHGFLGSSEELFTFMNGQARQLLDHMIASKEIRPVIVVAPSFHTEGQATDWDLSEKELRAYHKELRSDLIPAVEKNYHTYAGGETTLSSLAASRDHRGYGGFSMGSVSTWYQLAYNGDIIRYFLPMSGACWEYGGMEDDYAEENTAFLEKAIKDNALKKKGYLIYCTTGTKDYMEEQIDKQVACMRSGKLFGEDRLRYIKRKGGEHNWESYVEYLYNGLQEFFPAAEQQELPAVKEPDTQSGESATETGTETTNVSTESAAESTEAPAQTTEKTTEASTETGEGGTTEDVSTNTAIQ